MRSDFEDAMGDLKPKQVKRFGELFETLAHYVPDADHVERVDVCKLILGQRTTVDVVAATTDAGIWLVGRDSTGREHVKIGAQYDDISSMRGLRDTMNLMIGSADMTILSSKEHVLVVKQRLEEAGALVHYQKW